MQRILRLSMLLLSSAFAAHFAFADPLYTFDSVNKTFIDNPVTLGFTFTANTAFNVTSLGWYDPGSDGFHSVHTVGIFDANGNLLTSTTLAMGTTDPLSGSFRYQSIQPIILQAGSTYVLAGTTGGPAYAYDAYTENDQFSGFAINPAFTIAPDAALYTYGPDFVDPSSHYSDYVVYAGPNLDGSPVPEPASLLLLALTAPILFFFSGRRHHSNSI